MTNLCEHGNFATQLPLSTGIAFTRGNASAFSIFRFCYHLQLCTAGDPLNSLNPLDWTSPAFDSSSLMSRMPLSCTRRLAFASLGSLKPWFVCVPRRPSDWTRHLRQLLTTHAHLTTSRSWWRQSTIRRCTFYIHCYGLTSKQDLSTIQRHLQFLRSALTTWTARNSLPSLPKVHLDDLWQRSNLTTSHSTTTSPTRTSHASSNFFQRPSFTMTSYIPLNLLSSNLLPMPPRLSPTHWFFRKLDDSPKPHD